MPTFAAQITIGDYAKWRPVFDKNKHLRDKAGLMNVRVYRDADNPNELIIWSEASDAAKAREALNGPEIRGAMQEAGLLVRQKAAYQRRELLLEPNPGQFPTNRLGNPRGSPRG
jgi:quinol monooxygenase YgiN